jgi:hypothetical protein
MSGLDPHQKGTVCGIAREAWDAWAGRGEFSAAHPGTNPFTAWRHAEQLKAVGQQSLTRCTPDQYRALCAHFIRLRTLHLRDASNQHLFQNSHHE